MEAHFGQLKTAKPKLYFVGVGSADKLTYAPTQTLLSELKKQGIEYKYRETSHGHWWGARRIISRNTRPSCSSNRRECLVDLVNVVLQEGDRK